MKLKIQFKIPFVRKGSFVRGKNTRIRSDVKYLNNFSEQPQLDFLKRRRWNHENRR